MEIETFKIIRSKRKTIAIQIDKDASLVVRAPFHASDKVIKDFINKKKSWITKKQKLVKERNLKRPRKRFAEGEEFLYLGDSYKLHLVEDNDVALSFDDGFLLARDYVYSAREIFIYWYRQEALQKIGQRIELYSAISGLKYRKINITNARQRLGSCKTDGNISFAWRLIMAPPEVIDYVVAHEISHLAYLNHSRRFWKKVEVLFPEYSQCKKWLKDNGHLLDI